MYSIQTVIYGVPVTEKISDKIEKWEQEDSDKWYEDKDGPCGFTKLYHGGSSGMVGYCGVELGEMDEAVDWCRIDAENKKIEIGAIGRKSQFSLDPTPTQVEQAKKKLEKLPEELRKLCLPVGVYIIYSSS